MIIRESLRLKSANCFGPPQLKQIEASLPKQVDNWFVQVESSLTGSTELQQKKKSNHSQNQIKSL